MHSPNFDLPSFIPTSTLCTSQAQKRVFLLGSQPSEPSCQAIVILNPKTPSSIPQAYTRIDSVFHNDIYYRYEVKFEGEFEVQAIFPATQKHKSKYRQRNMVLRLQTADQYRYSSPQLLQKQLSHLGWVHNIMAGSAQQQRVLHRDPQFIILPDFKFAVMTQTQSLHLLVLFTDPALHSIRDLRGQHLPLLHKARAEVDQVLQSRFGLEAGACRMYFHYPPTFYQLHLHVSNLELQGGGSGVERAHLWEAVVANLGVCGQYYDKVALVKLVEM